MKNKIEDIYIKNDKINELVKNIFDRNVKTIEISNGQYKFTPMIEKVMNMEMKKIIATYLAEFSEYISAEKENQMLKTKFTIYESDELDAHGYPGEVAFPSNAQDFLEKLYNEQFFPIKYTQDSNGKIRYDSNGVYNSLENVKLVGENGENYIFDNEEKLENDADFKDFCVYAKLTNMKEREFFLRAMPHELMHTLGFGGGIFEGETENLTRQTCQKYNIKSLPIGHPEETHIMQQIEKIIGGENLIKYSYLDLYDSVEDVEKINELMNQKITTEEGKDIFKKYAYYDNRFFAGIKQGSSKEEQEELWQKYKESESYLKNMLDTYVKEHKDKLYELGEDKEGVSLEDETSKNLAYDKVLKLQDIEIEYLELLVRNQERETKVNQNKKKDIEELEL